MASDSEAAHGMCMVIAVVVLAGHALSSAFARATRAPPLSFTSPNGRLVAVRNSVAFAFAVAGVAIMASQGHGDSGSCTGAMHNATAGHDSHSTIATAHANVGWAVIALMLLQVLLALLAWFLGGGDSGSSSDGGGDSASSGGQEMKSMGPTAGIVATSNSSSSNNGGGSEWPIRLRQLHRWVGWICMAIILCFQLWSGGEALAGWLTGGVLLVFSGITAGALIGCSLVALRSQGGVLMA